MVIFLRNWENYLTTGADLLHNTFELHQFAQHAAQLQGVLDRSILTFGSSP